MKKKVLFSMLALVLAFSLALPMSASPALAQPAGECLYLTLDDYNNGLLCAPSRDTSPCIGTGTPGYWKNHPEAWPVDTITIGGVQYSKAAAIAWMQTPVKGDKTITMFAALVAAKLNVALGNVSTCIDSYIAAADAWMAANGPVGSGVKGNDPAW